MNQLCLKLAGTIEKIDGCEIVSPRRNCLPNTLSFVVRGADSIALLAGLDVEGTALLQVRLARRVRWSLLMWWPPLAGAIWPIPLFAFPLAAIHCD